MYSTYSRVLVIVILATAPAFLARAADLSIKPGDQIVTVNVQDAKQLAALEAMDFDIWSDEYGIGPVDVHVSSTELKKLQAAGFSIKIKNHDLFAARRRELAELSVRAAGDFTAYKDLAGINTYLNNLVAARPDLCSISSAGLSLEGRSIAVLKITGPTGGSKPAVFYHGLIHAREWIAGSVVMYIAEYLVNNYDTDPCVADLLNKTEIYLAPCVNPDGYDYTWTTQRLWRKNRRGGYGVDINRNFGYQWGYDNSGSSSSTSSDIYRGPSAFSEPETQVIRDFITNHANIRAYMDYHSYSQLLMWPWGYTPSLTPDNARFAAIGNYMQQLITAVNGVFYQPGPVNATIYPANGVSIDWAYGAAGRFAYTIELRDTGTNGFLLPADQILPTCQENLQGILYLTRWATYGVLLDALGTPTQLAAGQPTTISVNLNDGQESYVPGSGSLYYRFSPSDPYSSVPLVLQSGTTYTATIPAAPCGQTAQFYIAASGNGGSTAYLPCGAPTSTYSAPVVNVQPPQVIYDFPMTSNPGWSVTGTWAYGTPTGSCSDPASGHTGSNVYGYNLTGCYTNNMPVRYLTTTALNCSNISGTQLRFWRWLSVESAQYDHASIQVSNDGTNWTTIWNFSGGTLIESAWSLQTYDISAVADGKPAVYVRWVMGPSDGGLTYGGWNIDDVQILGTPTTNCGAVLLGDVNQDGVVDGLDVSAFVAVLSNPSLATGVQTCAADINHVCGVTIEDLDPFVALLLGM